MKTSIVIGLGFGDEGKGLVTDYLCSKSSNPIVVRFSGGHQCGHTVVKDGIRHVFSNFGSGTLRGVPTYWHSDCTFEPRGCCKELSFLLGELKNTNIRPRLYVHENCPVTTPYEIHANQESEDNRRHGSCGVGFGATLQREEKYYHLYFKDLFYPSILKAKMKAISENYYGMYSNPIPELAERLEAFFACCETITSSAYVGIVTRPPESHHFSDFIFEGSQGLMLDQHHGIFPNVTRSNTGLTNILNMPYSLGIGVTGAELYLVTRAYCTRHGNGWMPNMDKEYSPKLDPQETNITNLYQGQFRRTMLDVSLLQYAINTEPFIRDSAHKNLVITCLDHISNDYRFTYHDKVNVCHNEDDFISKISTLLGIKNVLISRSCESKNISEYSGVTV